MKKSIKSTHPLIAADFHPTRNSDIVIDDLSKGSRIAIWWKCKNQHEYKVSIVSRIRSNGCKICNAPKITEKNRLRAFKPERSLAALRPDLLLQWDNNKNSSDPKQIMAGSHAKAFWICDKGHQWSAAIKSRALQNVGCQICSKAEQGERTISWHLKRKSERLFDKFPELEAEWDYDKNVIMPDTLLPFSGKKAHWKCQFGHSWITSISNRTTNGSQCPHCNASTSRLEIFILTEARTIFKNVFWRSKIGQKEIDVEIRDEKIAIEVDGGYWHRNKLELDNEKNIALTSRNYFIYRVRERNLPDIDGRVVKYDLSDDYLSIFCQLLEQIKLDIHSTEIDEYLLQREVRNEAEYRKILSFLPKPVEGSSLLDLFPEVSAEWAFERNHPLLPNFFHPNSNKKVWWKCNSNHLWEASIQNRAQRKSGCPICYKAAASEIVRQARFRIENSISVKRPDMAEEWLIESNGHFSPDTVTINSNLKIWWQCKFGHQPYLRRVTERNRTKGCPYCFSENASTIYSSRFVKKFGSINEQLLAANLKLNSSDIDPRKISIKSKRNYEFVCSEGHTFSARPLKLFKVSPKCPKCSFISVRAQHPDLIEDWADLDISPDEISAGSNRKIKWRCKNCEKYFFSTISTRLRSNKRIGCKECTYKVTIESVRLINLKNRGSLLDNAPEILKYWNGTLNDGLLPTQISSGSSKKVWWSCECGHQWQATPLAMTDKRRIYKCPNCKDG